ncbi:TPA: hypothetical protein MXS88_005472 [Klebsiella pneumoniae]|nr:hypothetical protein [Klebsiella pneumoniae]
MARVHAIKRSGLHIDIDYVVHKKIALDRAVILRYSTKNPDYHADFVGLSEPEIEREKDLILKENDTTHCLLLLTAIEAIFLLDADQKYCNKKRDPLSRKIKEIYDKTKGEKIKLDDDLINTRMNEDDARLKKDYNDLKTCFKFRHWLAHGRYWHPKRIKNFYFDSILIVIDSILNSTKYNFEV